MLLKIGLKNHAFDLTAGKMLTPYFTYRKYRNYIWLLLSFLLFVLAVRAQNNLPADKMATKETVDLYQHLQKLLKQGVMIGHQDDMAYGVHWKYQEGRSDVKEVTGLYPAVFGWDLGHIETGSKVNLDSVPFDKMQQWIKDAYAMGAVITLSWHLNNPLTGKSAWDVTEGTVTSILPGGEKNNLYKSWLDKVATFLNALKDEKGKLIPVIFRPFHELNGSWFWWGKNLCTTAEIKRLYQFTEEYLQQEKNIHHLLFAYNTDRFADEDEYMERYPGDDYVDILGFDIYQRNSNHQAFVTALDKSLTILEKIAVKKNKIPALTEFGYNGLPYRNWWTQVLWQGLKNHHISYALAWRNAGMKSSGETEFYMPYKGQKTARDFRAFSQLRATLFLKDIKNKNNAEQ